ncbi:MAG: hypothetical protein LV473_03440 [Nitrospira sp.]|nr:hypothetical protein [Nitrospira sp.]
MIIVDTTVWVDYLRGTSSSHSAWLESNLAVERLGLTDLILCEVLQGVGSSEAGFLSSPADTAQYERNEQRDVTGAVMCE